MKKYPENENLDELTQLMIKARTKGKDNDFPAASPFFLARIQARIQEHKKINAENWLTSNILATQKWLLAVTAIALLIFGSSLWVTALPQDNTSIVLQPDENASLEYVLDDPFALSQERK